MEIYLANVANDFSDDTEQIMFASTQVPHHLLMQSRGRNVYAAWLDQIPLIYWTPWGSSTSLESKAKKIKKLTISLKS